MGQGMPPGMGQGTAQGSGSSTFFLSIVTVVVCGSLCMAGTVLLAEVQGEKKCAAENDGLKKKYSAGLYTFLIGFITILLFLATFFFEYHGLKYPRFGPPGIQGFPGYPQQRRF